ncbi:MAG: hypothetical protein DI537_05475 [Stutzerimonas stutzeri]|nr:MAG: hypothetical protein DI537_05475 [Stutzerimonas stutzeri]
MTSIGTQALEAAARSQEPDSEASNVTKDLAQEDSKNSFKTARKPTARERVAATAEVVFANRYMPGAKIHSAGDVMLNELHDRSLAQSAGGEGDLTERDAFATISKLAHQGVQMPMGGLAMAVRHEYQEASGQSHEPDKAAAPAPPLSEQMKQSFQEGLKATKPAARRRNDGGIEL